MVYSKPPHLNPFPAQSQAPLTTNQQKLADALELAKENDRIKNFIQTNKDKKKEETERISDDMGHNDKIVRHAEPANRFPEDEKSEQRIEDERKEMHERRIKGMDGNYLKDLEKDLANCRATLASVEYSEGARLAEVRKRLHGAKELEGRTFEESTSLKSARDHYQRTLDRLKKAKIEELEKKNLPEAALRREMAELIKYFGFCEVVEMNNAEKDAKAESHLGAGIAKKCWGMFEKTANAYNKLPLWQKLGISAGTFALGAAGAIGLVGAKRVLSGVVAGVGTAKGLDALHQRSVGKTADRDVAKIIEEMDKVKIEGTDEEKKEKRHELMLAALDVKLENVDARLKRQGMVSLCNKFIGVSVGVFLGSGMTSKAIAGAVEYFHPSETVPSISLKSYENFKEINSSGAIAGKDLVGATMAAGHDAPVEVGVPSESMDASAALHQASESTMEQTITIEKGSSIEKTLIDHIRSAHPDIKNPGQAAHRMWLDYMHDNKDEIIKKVGNGEYQKMLKDGMVNIKSGTQLIIDEKTGLIKEIKGEIKLLHGIDKAHGIGQISADPTMDPPAKIGPSFSAGATNVENLNVGGAEKGIVQAPAEFKDASVQYSESLNKIGGFKHITESEITTERGVMWDANEAMNKSAEAVKNSISYKSDMKSLVISSLKNFNEDGKSLLSGNEHLRYSQAMADDKLGPKLKTFREVCSKIITKNVKAAGGSYFPSLNPEAGESIKRYMQRVMITTMESKYGILRG